MFETLAVAKPDNILALMKQFNDDPRPKKVDLGVGVYRNETGHTPVMGAIKEAEHRLLDAQKTKTYIGPLGDIGFNSCIVQLVFGDRPTSHRIRSCQTPGGCGALRIIADLLASARPHAHVWVSDPTWPNHLPLIAASGLKIRNYPYLDSRTGQVQFDEMLEALKDAAAGDVVLLHGCCHNPTGANLTPTQWQTLAELISNRGLFPFIDLAYQGFGDGLEEDAFGTRVLYENVPEMAIAVSCSKNFGTYRDRVGCAILVGETDAQVDIALGHLLNVTRSSYSMPPDHGAAAVRIVLEDEVLRADWETELEHMRTRLLRLREGIADALKRHSNSDRFDFLKHHRGMFSRLPISEGEVERLRIEHGIYMVGDGRINVAGLPEQHLDDIAKAILNI